VKVDRRNGVGKYDVFIYKCISYRTHLCLFINVPGV